MHKIFKEDCVTNTGSPGNELSLNRNQQVLKPQLTKMASSDKVGLIRLKFLGSQSFDRQLFSVFQQFILTGAQVEGLLCLFLRSFHVSVCFINTFKLHPFALRMKMPAFFHSLYDKMTILLNLAFNNQPKQLPFYYG